MPTPNKLTPEDVTEIVTQAKAAKKSKTKLNRKALAKGLGVTASAISYQLKRFGFTKPRTAAAAA